MYGSNPPMILENVPTGLEIYVPGYSNLLSPDGSDSSRTSDSIPELTHDELSPSSTAEPTTPGANWPMSDVNQATLDQSSSSSPKDKPAVQLPTLYLSSPSSEEAHNILGTAFDDGDPLQTGRVQNFDNIHLVPRHTDSSSFLHHSDETGHGSTIVSDSPPYSPLPFVPTVPSHFVTSTPQIPTLESISGNIPLPEPYPMFTPPATASTTHPVSGGGQQTYWTVDPFQNPVANESPQESTSIHLLPMLKPVQKLLTTVSVFCVDTLPRQVYLHLLLRLPRLYFSRLTRIFHDAELSLPEMRKLALVTWAQHHGAGDYSPISLMRSELNPMQSGAFGTLKSNWEAFIDSLMTEWKMNNIVAVLLLSAILAILQIDDVSNDPIARYAALASLVCGLMGLLYGCMYTVRFGTMRKAYKAIQWAEEAQKTRTHIFWNVWVFLAMPAIWLCWSIILFLTSIMAYVWRTGSNHDPVLRLSPKGALGPRLAVTGLFGLGVLYFGLIVLTLRRYGDIMDENWKKRVASWVKENIPREVYAHSSRSRYLHTSLMTPSGFTQMPFPATPLTSADHTTPPNNPWIINGWGIPFSNSGAPRIPNYSPWPTSNPSPPTQGRSPNFSHGYPNSSPLMQPYRTGTNTPLAMARGNLQPTPIRLPIEPDPLTLIPSPSVSKASNVVVEVSPAYASQSQFPRCGPTSGVWDPRDLENIYKAILPVALMESNPFRVETTSAPRIVVSLAPFGAIRIMGLSTSTDSTKDVPESLGDGTFIKEDWKVFINDMELAWRNQHPVKQIKPQLNSEYFPISQYPRRHDFVACLLHWWNDLYFAKRGARAFLCEEFLSDSPWKTNFAIYLTAHDASRTQPKLRERFKNITTVGLRMINIYPPFDPGTPNLILVAESVLLDRPSIPTPNLTSPFPAVKMTELGLPTYETVSLPRRLEGRDIDLKTWNRFITAMQNNWINEEHINTNSPVQRPPNFIPCFIPFCEQLLDAWNTDYFKFLNMEAFLCREFSRSRGYSYAIYLTHMSTFPKASRFETALPGVTELKFYQPNIHGPPQWTPVSNSSNIPTSPKVHFGGRVLS